MLWCLWRCKSCQLKHWRVELFTETQSPAAGLRGTTFFTSCLVLNDVQSVLLQLGMEVGYCCIRQAAPHGLPGGIRVRTAGLMSFSHKVNLSRREKRGKKQQKNEFNIAVVSTLSTLRGRHWGSQSTNTHDPYYSCCEGPRLATRCSPTRAWFTTGCTGPWSGPFLQQPCRKSEDPDESWSHPVRRGKLKYNDQGHAQYIRYWCPLEENDSWGKENSTLNFEMFLN